MTKLDLFWMDWSHINELTGEFVLNEDAPKEAKESYFKYIKQMEDIDKRTTRTFVIPKTKEGIKWYKENDPDWDRGTYETKDIIVYDIPYDEFCILRKIEGIECLITEGKARDLSLTDIENCIVLLKKNNPELTEIIKVLNRILQCKTFVDFVEAHII